MKEKIPVFVSHPIFERQGYPASHPLAIARVGPVVTLSQMLGWLPDEKLVHSEPAELSTMLTFHDPDYLEALQRVSATGQASPDDREKFGLGTAENPVFSEMLERIGLSVGGSILAAQKALECGVAFHPAGGTHHGRPGRASGFCYSNDPVFAIYHLLGAGVARVAYVDLDAHHGDGVEAAFVDEPRVLCISLHEQNRWPGTGKCHTPSALNYPVPRGFDDAALASIMEIDVLPAMVKFAPDAVVLTCGADALRGDPLSGLALSNKALWHAVSTIVALCPTAVVLGGGGYNPWTTVRYWTGLWATLNHFAIPEKLPREATTLLAQLSCDLVDDEDLDPQWLTSLADTPEVQL